MKTYRCPDCQSQIPMEDVNVAADIALCKSCGQTHSFALLCGIANISLEILQSPPKHIKITQDSWQKIILTYRRVPGVVFFLIPFTAIWSGGSMWGIYGTQILSGKFDLTKSLFGLPFLLGTIVLVSILVYCLFGKWQITLADGQGTVFVGIGSLGWTRRFMYNRNSVVALVKTSLQVNDIPQKGIQITTDGAACVFGASIKEESKQYIAAWLLNESRKAR